MLKFIDKLKDPGSALTHFLAFILTLLAAVFLFSKAVGHRIGSMSMVTFIIFIISMLLLYAASTTYHSFNISKKINTLLRKIDHMMIFVLITGTYAPICLSVLGGKTGITLFSMVCGISLLGILINIFWINYPKWISSVIYIGLGWLCSLALTKIIASMPKISFIWLLVGGVIYTVGGVVYALKLKCFDKFHRYFGIHEIFHLFVMGGSFCHFMLMYSLI